jgi:hypothetical protein
METLHRVERYPVTRLCVCQVCGRFFVVTVSNEADEDENADPPVARLLPVPIPLEWIAPVLAARQQPDPKRPAQAMGRAEVSYLCERRRGVGGLPVPQSGATICA